MMNFLLFFTKHLIFCRNFAELFFLLSFFLPFDTYVILCKRRKISWSNQPLLWTKLVPCYWTLFTVILMKKAPFFSKHSTVFYCLKYYPFMNDFYLTILARKSFSRRSIYGRFIYLNKQTSKVLSDLATL